jgi:hypothetical protein
MRIGLAAGLVDRLERCAGEFELPAWLERDRAEAGRVGQSDDVALVLDAVPAEEPLHQLEELPDATLALVGHGAAIGFVEAELFMLGADAPCALRLGAGGERLDQLVARFDRRRVGNVAGHACMVFQARERI